jgi:hypothetical protein
MRSRSQRRSLLAGVLVGVAMAACSQTAPPAVEPTAAAPQATTGIEGITPVGTVEAHFNPTEAVGGGALGSNAVSNLTSVFDALPQATQLTISANSSPPGATGPDVQSVSIVAQDKGGLLKGLDAAGKKSLGDALLTAAGTAWPNASVSLLVTDPAGGGGQIIGSRPKGGPNTVFAT